MVLHALSVSQQYIYLVIEPETLVDQSWFYAMGMDPTFRIGLSKEEF